MIIIGAGISGIGASRTLSKQGVSHLILESRDRFGGRIYPNNFAGCNVEIGATFVHCPKQHNNLISKYLS
jgi:monoamine oxidase